MAHPKPVAMAIGLSIAFVEQFFVPGSPSAVCRNPGRLMPGHGQKAHPEHGIAVFKTEAAGFRALYELIEMQGNAGLTIREFFAGKRGSYPGFCPKPENRDPDGYARFVVRHAKMWLSYEYITPDSVIEQLY